MSEQPQSPQSPPAPGTMLPTKRPDDTPFKQQRLPAWQPVMSPPYIIGCFAVIAVIFISIGAAVIVASDGIVDVSHRYDQFPCPWEDRKDRANFRCETDVISFEITKTMKAPVFIYYKLENFYQNHRRYARSRAETQLSGGQPTSENLADCEPFMYPGQYSNVGNASRRIVFFSNRSDPIDITQVRYNPCGLIAWSKFNDTFTLTQETPVRRLICKGDDFDEQGNRLNGSLSMACEKKGITWPSDPGVRFASPRTPNSAELTSQGWPEAPVNNTLFEFLHNGWYINEPGHRIPSTIDLDLMVWMRLASLSSFRKLYRRITEDLQPGSYQMHIDQAFDVRSFSGKKSFVITTNSWVGGKNYFLGGLYVAVGGLCLILAVAFIVKHVTTPQRVSLL